MNTTRCPHLISFCLYTTLASFASPVLAASSQQVIRGFHFQSCDQTRCIEASAPQAWLSQLDNSFSSPGPTHIVIRSKAGQVLNDFKGLDSSYSSTVDVLTLDREDGSSVFISLQDGSVRFFGLAKTEAAK